MPKHATETATILSAKFDGTTETATLQAAVTAAAGGTLLIPANKTIKSAKITIPASGITIRGAGKSSVLDYIDGGTTAECLFEAISATNFTVEDCTIKSSNATGRTSVWGLIRARLTTGFKVRRVMFGKSSSCAIWTSETTEFQITDIDIDGTYADGIHISRGSAKGSISDIRAKNLGDDIVGLNSYTNDGATTYTQMTDISVTDVKGYNIGTGRGVAINGCKRVRVSDVMIDGVAQAAVLVSSDAGTFTTNEDITIENVKAKNTGQNVPGGGTSGALYAANTAGLTLRGIDGGAVSIASTVSGLVFDERRSGDELTAGQEGFSRDLVTSSKAMTSGALFLSYFTARKNETQTKVRTYTVGTAAAATPTLVRIGLYEVLSNGDLSLVASTASDTALYAATNTAYEKALQAGYALVKGKRYAYGILVVSAAAVPALAATTASVVADELAKTPRLNGVATGLSDLPATVTAGSVGATAQRVYAALIP
jgi:hypothetical protein